MHTGRLRLFRSAEPSLSFLFELNVYSAHLGIKGVYVFDVFTQSLICGLKIKLRESEKNGSNLVEQAGMPNVFNAQ